MEIYTPTLSRDDLQSQLIEIKNTNKTMHWNNIILRPFRDDILFYTKEFDKFDNITKSERIYVIINNLTYRPRCRCGEYRKYLDSGNYSTYCCKECMTNKPVIQIIKTFEDREDLQLQLIEIRKNNKKMRLYSSKFNQFRSAILFYTNEFNKFNDITNPERIHAIINNHQDRPKCYCGEYVTYGGGGVYSTYCSKNCASNSPLVRQHYKETMLERYGHENPFLFDDHQDKSKATRLERYGDENYNNQAKYKETMLERYGVEHTLQYQIFFDKQIKSSFNRKPFTFLSGKEVMVQGFEPQILAELVHHFDEDDIIVGGKNVPEIWYYTDDGKKHRYFADIYVKSRNMIIEVKSTHTLRLEKGSQQPVDEVISHNNLLKRQACINDGFVFWFAVGE